jgi:hypothetical protein
MLSADKLAVAVLAVLGLLLLAIAGFSTQWRMEHDAPLMFYYAFLVDRFDYVPYRDFFEHQPPGAHFAYSLIARVFGYGDAGFRAFDLLYLAAILGTTGAWLSLLGRRVAWAGIVLFGLAYLGYGHVTAGQRDFLMLLPLSTVLLLQLRFPGLDERIRALLSGLLLGVAFNLKPQVAVLFPAVVVFQLWRWRRELPSGSRLAGPVVAVLSATALGVALPTAAAAAVLWRDGTLGTFLEIVGSYWPLFASLDRWHRTISGLSRIPYLAEEYQKLGGHGLWLVPATLGASIALLRPDLARAQKDLVALLASLALLSSVFTLSSGRFWDYHWMLFLYFLLLTASLCFLPAEANATRSRRLAPLLTIVAVILLNLHPPMDFLLQVTGRDIPGPKRGRVDEIAGFLGKNLEPGDTVQPLDWTGGAVHAMLIAEAKVATPWVTDFSFHHHVSDPYIRELRRRFADDLKRAMPRFIIRVLTHKPWPSGRDTSQEFPALEELLREHYRVAISGKGYRIYRRRDPA